MRGVRITRVPVGLFTILVVLLLAEVASRGGMVAQGVFPPPTAIVTALAVSVPTPEFSVSVGQTLLAWGIGLGLAVAIAVPLGLVIGSIPAVYTMLRTTIEFCRPVPPVALIPVLLLVLGATLEMKVVLVVLAAVWPLLFQTLYGVRDVDRVLLDTAAVFRQPRFDRALRIVLPSTLPYVVTGVRIAATIALIVTIAAELVSGSPGLGADIKLAQSSGNSAESFALTAFVGLLGLAINVIFRLAERSLLHWHPAHREEVTS